MQTSKTIKTSKNPFFQIALLHGSKVTEFTIHREFKKESTQGFRFFHLYVLSSTPEENRKPLQYLILQNDSRRFVDLIEYKNYSLSEVCRIAQDYLNDLVLSKNAKLLLQA